MKLADAKRRIEELRKTINEHNHRYYVLNQPVITDFELTCAKRLQTHERTFRGLVTPDHHAPRGWE